MRLAFALVFLAFVASASAQQTPSPTSASPAPTAFEVASVRLAPGAGTPSQRMTDSRVDLSYTPLRAVLLLAFRAKGYELVAPDWLADTRVSIQATMPPAATRQHVPELLQRLLAERFHLVVHREPRATEVYELSVSPGGHRMREVEPADEFDKTFPASKVAEQVGTVAAVDTVQDTPDGSIRTVRGDDLGMTTLTARTMYKLTLNMDRLGRRTQTLDATRITMPELAAILTASIGQPVLDSTGLRGTYQFNSVELPLDARILQAARISAATRGVTFEAPDVSVTKAMEGLGLRLDRRRAPVDVIVVDSIDRAPTDN